jgi:hypothetical protein
LTNFVEPVLIQLDSLSLRGDALFLYLLHVCVISFALCGTKRAFAMVSSLTSRAHDTLFFVLDGLQRKSVFDRNAQKCGRVLFRDWHQQRIQVYKKISHHWVGRISGHVWVTALAHDSGQVKYFGIARFLMQSQNELNA